MVQALLEFSALPEAKKSQSSRPILVFTGGIQVCKDSKKPSQGSPTKEDFMVHVTMSIVSVEFHHDLRRPHILTNRHFGEEPTKIYHNSYPTKHELEKTHYLLGGESSSPGLFVAICLNRMPPQLKG